MKVVIVGGIAAGMSAAAKARRIATKDTEIVVYEKGEVVSFGGCGLPYYVGDFFENKENMIARTPEEFEKSGIKINLSHEVLNIDFNGKILTVKNLKTKEIFKASYDKLMLATGSEPIFPPIKNIKNLKNIFSLKFLDDGIALKKAMKNDQNQEVAVIGAGYIGLEVVEAAKQYGKNVRIVQLDDRVLPLSFDKEITDIMEDELEKHGVKLHLEEVVKEVVGDEKVEKIVTNKGEYKADIVVVTTGVRPATKFLENTKIKMAKGAIVVDSQGKSSIEDVYAAGDCATVYHRVRGKDVYIPLATTANKIGRVVGENLVGGKEEFNGTLGSACIKVMDLEAGRTGITEKEAKLDGINYKIKFIKGKNQTNYYPGQEDIWIKLIYEAESNIILGGQIIGKSGAVLRVDTLAIAITNKVTTYELGMMDFCYSPPFSGVWDILNVVGNVSKN